MSLNNYLPVFEYDFRKDPHMQELGMKLFPSAERIALSKGTMNQDIISFVIYEDTVTANKSIRISSPNITIRYYAEFDEFKDWYNLIILIETTTRNRNVYHTIAIPGDRPDEQNQLIKILDKRHSTEVWYSNYSKTFISVKAPIKEVVENIDFLKKIVEQNNQDMKECVLCGRQYSHYIDSIYCPDCISKMIVDNNRK